MSIVAEGGALVWTDAMGKIWTMPSTGGTPRALAVPDFAFKVVGGAGGIFATTRKDLMRVDSKPRLCRGAQQRECVAEVAERATKLELKLPEYPEDIVGDADAVYLTLFKKPQILRVAGTQVQTIGELPRGVLALHGDTLYVVSYATGVLVAIPKTGGKARTVAKGLVRTTALAADATHAFAYSEKDQTLSRIDLASGAATVIARNLVNSDDLVADGDWLYTRSWDKGSTGSLVRVAKDGSAQEPLGADLAAPYNIAVDDDAVYVTARDGAQIVRFTKR